MLARNDVANLPGPVVVYGGDLIAAQQSHLRYGGAEPNPTIGHIALDGTTFQKNRTGQMAPLDLQQRGWHVGDRVIHDFHARLVVRDEGIL